MQFNFHKYQGTGNDFVMIDNRNLFFEKTNTELIAQICHRRFGVGADGLILLENEAGFAFRMIYFNANGLEGSMCGNGGRCTVAFAKALGVFDTKTTFMAVDGEHEAFIENDLVHLKMQNVGAIEENTDAYFLDTGSPHYVRFVQDLKNFDVLNEGKAVRYNERFKEKGTNVNFVEQIGDNQLFVRTYERGVEDETYSCGTGVTACALVANLKGLSNRVSIRTLGGELSIAFQQNAKHQYEQIYLIGPAQKVFEGVWTSSNF